MGDLSRGERLQIMLTPRELKLLDDWRFSRRMPSRAAAIRELLKRGLVADGFASAEEGSMSKDFGIDSPAEQVRRPPVKETLPLRPAHKPPVKLL
jgi:hypothetical protein